MFSLGGDWVGTGKTTEQEVKTVVAADGKRYSKVVRAEKEVNFDDGSIRFRPVPDAEPRLVIED